MKCCNFSSLPTELVLSVAEFLPIRSVACLSLTCKALYYSHLLRRTWTLGFDPNEQHCDCKHGLTSCCPGLEIKNHEPLLFLQLLEKDLPGKTRCDYCQRLHPRRQTKKLEYGFWEWLGDSCPTSCSGMWLRFDTWSFALRFEDVQKVMKRHRWGDFYGDRLESIAISTGWQSKKYWSWGWNTNWTGKFDVEPRIIHGNLMIRTCQRMLMERDEISIRPPKQIREIVARKSTICHAGCEFRELNLWQQVKKSMESLRSQTVNQRPLSNDNEIVRCGSCLTEFAIAVQDLGEVGIEFVLNTWVNLGTCRNTYSPAWLGAAWHDHNMYSQESVSKAQNTAMLESGYVSTHDRSWVNPARYISAVEYPSPKAIHKMYISTCTAYDIPYGSDGTRSRSHAEDRDPDWQDIIQRWEVRYVHGYSTERDLEDIPPAPAKPRTGYLGQRGTSALCEDMNEKRSHPEYPAKWLVPVACQSLGRIGPQTQTAETGALSTGGVQTAGEPLKKSRSRLLSGIVALWETFLKWFRRD